MLKRIATQLSGLGMDLCTRLWAWLTTRLWNPVSNLLVSFTRKFQNVINLLNPLVQMVLSFKAWAVSLTTVARSINQGRSIAKAKAIQIGSQLLTTVHQTLQRVATAIKKINVLVALMKWVASRINASKTVLTLIAHQWIQAGLKLLDHANPHRLAAYLSQRLERVRVTLTNWVLLVTKKIAAALTLMVNRLKAIGLKLQDSVHLLLQRVLRLQSLSKKLVEKTKLVQSLLKKAVAALTHTVSRLKALGLKQGEAVRQPPQRARRRRSKEH